MTGRGHIRRRGEGSWEVKYDQPGATPGARVTRYRTIKGTKRVAQAALTSILSDIDRGAHVDPSEVMLRDFLQRWLDDWAASNVSAKTIERYRELVANQIVPHLGPTPIQRIQAVHLQRLYADLLKAGSTAGEPLAPLTVGHVHRLLRRALGHAQTWGIIQQNPAAAVHPPKVPEREIEIASDAEISTVLDHLRARDHSLYTIAVLALATGARRGELCALRWQDVDLDGGAIRIERSLEQTAAGLAFRAPKTKKSRRSVSIPPSTVTELRAHRLAQQEQRLALGLGRIAPEGLVFAMPDGSPRKPKALTGDWLRACAAAGSRINLHSLRHVHVSNLIRAGVDVLAISRRVGHASPMLTLSRYGHLVASTDDRATQAVGAPIGFRPALISAIGEAAASPTYRPPEEKNGRCQ